MSNAFGFVPRVKLSILPCALWIGLLQGACSSTSNQGGSGGSSASNASNTGGLTAQGGATTNGGSQALSGGTASTTGGAASGGSNTSSGGATSGGSVSSTGGSPSDNKGGFSASGGTQSTGGNAGSNNGSGGSNANTGGSSSGSSGNGGGSPSGGTGTEGGKSGTGGVGGSSSSNCPSGASFCTGFEDSGLPAGTSFMPSYQAMQWSDFVTIDSSVFHSGSHSFQVKPTGSSGYSYRILSVKAPGPSFWARVWVRSDQDFGQSDHNAFFGASTTDADQNSGTNMEIAEQYCQVVLNMKDKVVNSKGGTTTCNGMGALLAKNAWHCMEAFFDGPNGAVQVYADGNSIIDSTAWDKLTYQSFFFGFIEFHGPSRTMWYDDVAIGTQRVGCP